MLRPYQVITRITKICKRGLLCIYTTSPLLHISHNWHPVRVLWAWWWSDKGRNMQFYKTRFIILYQQLCYMALIIQVYVRLHQHCSENLKSR